MILVRLHAPREGNPPPPPAVAEGETVVAPLALQSKMAQCGCCRSAKQRWQHRRRPSSFCFCCRRGVSRGCRRGLRSYGRLRDVVGRCCFRCHRPVASEKGPVILNGVKQAY